MAKDSPRTTAGELQKKVEFRSQKTFTKFIKQPLHHHMLFGRVSRKKSRKENAFTKKQSPAYSVIRHNWNFKCFLNVWIFQLDNNPKTNLKNNTKMGHWAQNQASAMAIPAL